MTQRRILVTGATGFIGQHLVRSLIQRGDFVRAMGRDAGVLSKLQAQGCETVRGDLRDCDRVVVACRGLDLVCHVGAFSSPWGRRQEFLSSNVMGTRHVLAGCQKHGVRRCVYISSPSVTSTRRDLSNQTESAPYPARTISLYSLSKRLAEETVRRESDARLEWVILRPKAVFGPGDQSLLPRLLRAAEAGRLCQIGDGLNRVDLTYVANVVHAIELAMEQEKVDRQTFLITNDEHPPLWDLVRRICRELGYNHRFRSIPFPLALTAATMMEWRAKLLGGEPMMTRYAVTILAKNQTYDISAAKQILGYRPIVDLEEGIEHTLKCSCQHLVWHRPT